MLKRITEGGSHIIESSRTPGDRIRFSSMTTYELHKKLINEYVLCGRGTTTKLQRDRSRDKRDIDVIRENHRFLWDDEDVPDSWEARLAKKYYDKLFKEYCICDLRLYKENKIGMRWRTEQEVVIGKGQFTCGNKHCMEANELKSWEVNFGYVEHGEKKNALVKIRLCPSCSNKLNYHDKKREVTKKSKRSSEEEENESRKKLRTEKEEEEKDKTEENVQKEKKNEEEEESEVWRKAGPSNQEKSRDEEFEDYLEQLLL